MEIRITNILNRFHCKFIPAKFIFRNGTKKKYAKYKAIPILGLINKNTIICEKDVKGLENEGIVFNFGGLKIEKKGKIIFENSEFIRIKNLDGTIEQIYKDGRLK